MRLPQLATALALVVTAFATATGAATPAHAGPQEACAYSASVRGTSCLVLVRGATVHEEYPNDGAADRAWLLASGTKSFSGLIAAALVQDGLARLDEPVSDTITEWKADARATITLRQLLTLTSGLETPRPLSNRRNLWPDTADAIAKPLAHPPGTVFAYGQVPFGVFTEFVARKLKPVTGEDAAAYLDRRILAPLGIRVAAWKRGGDGKPQLGGGAEMTARDWARFGEFVRNGGMIGGRPLADPATLAANFAGTPANPAYGLTWWVRPPAGAVLPDVPQLSGATDFTTLQGGPAEIWIAAGFGKQRLYIIPALEMVVVRQAPATLWGEAFGDTFSDAAFLALLLDL